jgi:hypothetical protein
VQQRLSIAEADKRAMTQLRKNHPKDDKIELNFYVA